VTEPIKWSALTPEQRDALVAEKVMGWKPGQICTGLFSDNYHCDRCGATSLSHEDHPAVPLPYTTSMDAAWAVWGKMKEDAKWHRFCFELDEVLTQHKYRREDRTYITWFEQFLSALNGDAICLAALRAAGVEIVEQETLVHTTG